MRGLLFLAAAGLLLTACQPTTSGEPTPTAAAPGADVGAVRVVITNLKAFWPETSPGLPVTLWTAPVMEGGPPGGPSVYVLEPSIHPHGAIGPGNVLQVENVPPGKYVMVIGPTPEEAVPIRVDGEAQVYDVVAGQLLDLGAIALEK
jgi:hypothetical protein